MFNERFQQMDTERGHGTRSQEQIFYIKNCIVSQIQTTAVVNPYSMTENTIAFCGATENTSDETREK